MTTPVATITLPLYKEDPFHSHRFLSYFEFLNQYGQHIVTCILKASKGGVGWMVDANLFSSLSVIGSLTMMRLPVVKVITSRNKELVLTTSEEHPGPLYMISLPLST